MVDATSNQYSLLPVNHGNHGGHIQSLTVIIMHIIYGHSLGAIHTTHKASKTTSPIGKSLDRTITTSQVPPNSKTFNECCVFMSERRVILIIQMEGTQLLNL